MSLITSLELARAGSRRLDIAIRDALFPEDAAKDFIFKTGFADQPWTHGETHVVIVENYTTSLDAALALAERVLPGWRWQISALEDGAIGSVAKWGGGHLIEFVSSQRDGDDVRLFPPALALCIAILRATNPKGQPNV